MKYLLSSLKNYASTFKSDLLPGLIFQVCDPDQLSQPSVCISLYRKLSNKKI